MERRIANQRQKSTIFILLSIMAFMFIVIVGLSFAYFTDTKTATNQLRFGTLKIQLKGGSGSGTISLSATGNYGTTSGGTYWIDPRDKLQLKGSVGLEDSSLSGYIRMKIKVEDDSSYALMPSIGNALMAEMAKIKDGAKQWFIVGDYMYLGNELKAKDPFTYQDSNTNSETNMAGANTIALIEEMLTNEMQGKTISVSFIYQALQSAKVNVGSLTEGYNQNNAKVISEISVWADAFEVKLDSLYSSSEYATSYVRGNLDDEAYKAGAKVEIQKRKSPFNYFEENSTGDYVAFGFYPQTVKSDEVTIKDFTNFNGGVYYVCSDGYLYERVGSSSYFKVEPIIWQIMKDNDTVGSQAYLISVAELTAKAFDSKTNKSNIYENSTIRTFLEGEFSSKAFTQAQRNVIKATTLTTSGYSNSTDPPTDKTVYNVGETGATTYKVFLPSYGDMKSYGYTTEAKDANRIKYPTGYASVKGADMSSNASEGGNYWSRSAYSSDYDVWSVRYDGYMYRDSPNPSNRGVVPALFLKIQ